MRDQRRHATSQKISLTWGTQERQSGEERGVYREACSFPALCSIYGAIAAPGMQGKGRFRGDAGRASRTPKETPRPAGESSSKAARSHVSELREMGCQGL